VLDRVDQFADFDPRVHYALTVGEGELTDVERNAARGTPTTGASYLDAIDLDPID